MLRQRRCLTKLLCLFLSGGGIKTKQRYIRIYFSLQDTATHPPLSLAAHCLAAGTLWVVIYWRMVACTYITILRYNTQHYF
jgi:hypothetical protein